MEQTLYRKYRPRTFKQLVGQDHVKQLFSHAILQDEIAHSYIFAGPRGTGKTTVARILAKRLNCLDPQQAEPCNQCDQCTAIDRSSHMDVIEMDAASNRGIDDFRAIRDNVSYLPAQGSFKVYIIDEVHMLTNEAFNAILKTLEEPPPQCIFILATTNPEKIPATIISRCQVIPYRNIGNHEIQQLLLDVAQTEKVSIQEGTALLIARYAKGGVRDALVMLEQLARFRGAEMIRPEDLLTMLGGVPPEWIAHLIQAIMTRDSNTIVKSADEVQQKGLNFEVVIQQMMDYLLELALSHPELSELIPIAKALMDLLKTIRYAENKQALFTVELLYLSQSQFEAQLEQDLGSKKEISKKEISIKEATNKETTNKETSKIIKESAGEERWLTQLKRERIDLFVAVCLGEYHMTDKIFTLRFQPHQQLSWEIAIRHETDLPVFFRQSLGKELECHVEMASGHDTEMTPDQLDPAAKKAYEKLQNLFPEETIRIRKVDN